MKEQIRELVKATLIIGAKRGRADYPTTEELEPLIEQHIDSMTERFLKLLPQGAVSGSLPTIQEIKTSLYKCAKVTMESDGVKMERLFEKEAKAMLALFGGNDH